METRLGTLDLKIPKLRQGTYFPAFLEPRKTAEMALTAVIQEAWIQGVSTRKVDDLVQALDMTGISKSQASALCQDIDTRVLSFLERPLDGEWPYLWLDATYIKVRQNGRIVSIAAIIATGVNQDGRREILGLGQSEAATFWIEFLRGLVRRGLKGVKLVISDAHEGLKAAITQVLLAAVPGALHEIAAGPCAEKPAVGRVGRCPAGLRPARSRDRRTSLAPRRRSAPPTLSQGRRSARRCRT